MVFYYEFQILTSGDIVCYLTLRNIKTKKQKERVCVVGCAGQLLRHLRLGGAQLALDAHPRRVRVLLLAGVAELASRVGAFGIALSAALRAVDTAGQGAGQVALPRILVQRVRRVAARAPRVDAVGAARDGPPGGGRGDADVGHAGETVDAIPLLLAGAQAHALPADGAGGEGVRGTLAAGGACGRAVAQGVAGLAAGAVVFSRAGLRRPADPVITVLAAPGLHALVVGVALEALRGAAAATL